MIRARAAAEERSLLAAATAAEKRAEAASFTALAVQAAGFEALGKLGGNGTTVFLGDWSRAPQFLWPKGYNGLPPMMTQPIAPVVKPAILSSPGHPLLKPLTLTLM